MNPSQIAAVGHAADKLPCGNGWSAELLLLLLWRWRRLIVIAVASDRFLSLSLCQCSSDTHVQTGTCRSYLGCRSLTSHTIADSTKQRQLTSNVHVSAAATLSRRRAVDAGGHCDNGGGLATSALWYGGQVRH